MYLDSFGVETVCSHARKASIGAVGIGIALILFLGVAVSGANAATLQVTTGGTDAGNCSDDPCATISYAVGQAADDDLIQAGAGEFVVSSAIIVNKAVTIAGAQAGVDARDRNLPSSAETVITSDPAFVANSPVVSLAAPGATVDGVTIRGHGSSAIRMATTSSGYAVRNTIMADNNIGIDLETVNVDPEATVIERNRFDRNNHLTAADKPGIQSGIYGDGPAGNVTIDDNLFVGHDNVPINLAGVRSEDRQKDFAIVGNTFQQERHVLLLAAERIDLTGNTFSEGRSQAISVQGGVQDLTVSGNTIEGAVDAGIIFISRYGAGANGAATVNDNSITGTTAGSNDPDMGGAAIAIAEASPNVPGYVGELVVSENRLVGNAGDGIRNLVDEATVDAPDNWWGCNTGPGGTRCDPTSGTVDSSPNVVLSLNTSADRVVAGAPVDITASVDTNSDGEPVDLPVLEGEDISFAADSGAVSPASAQIDGGTAVSRYSSGSAVGQAGITAEYDGQTIGAGVFVGAAASVASATVTGTGTAGDPLTCAAEGVAGTPQSTVTTAWLRSGAVINEQTGAAYTPTDGDIGAQITCEVTASNEFGSGAATSSATTIADRLSPPQPDPPAIEPKKGQVRVPSSGKVAIATIECPEGTCKVQTPKRVKIRIRGKVYLAKVIAPSRITDGGKATIRLVLPKNARKALRGSRTKAKVKIVLTSSNGERRVTNSSVKLKGAKKNARR